MDAPSLRQFIASVFNTSTTPKTLALTPETGDRIVVLAVRANAAGATTTAPTGGGLTYTQQASLGSTSSHGRAIMWTTTATSDTDFTLSCPAPGSTSLLWGVMAWVWSGSDGFGAVGAPTVNSTSNLATFSTTGANSAICGGSVDWNAVDGTTRTRRTINLSTGTEDTYFRDSAEYTVYGQRYADAGAAGSKSFGYSAPTGQASAIIAIEVFGTTSSSNTGTLTASLPVLAGSIAGTQTNPATLTASLPATTGTLTGQSVNPATLAGTTPVLTATITGTSTDPGTLAATLPAVTGSITGAATNPASLNAALPRLTGTLADQSLNGGTLAGALPLLTGSIAGGSANPAALAASLPRCTGSISATATNSGTLTASLPVLRGQLGDQSTNPATLAASVPRVAALLTGESVNPATLAASTPRVTGVCAGAMTNPATLTASVPRVTAALTGTTGSVDATPVQRPRLTLTIPVSAATPTIPTSGAAAAVPTSRAESNLMDGYTRNDTAPDLVLTLSSTPVTAFAGATVAVHVRKPGGTLLTVPGGRVTFDTANRTVTIRWATGDLDQRGVYLVEAQVTYSDSLIQTFPEASFVVSDELG